MSKEIETEIRRAVEISFQSEAGRWYRIQGNSNVADRDEGSWEDISGPIEGNDEQISMMVSAHGTHGYFRVVEIDAPEEDGAPDRMNKFIKYYDPNGNGSWRPIGSLMQEGSGLLRAAVWNSEKDPTLSVWEVELRPIRERRSDK